MILQITLMQVTININGIIDFLAEGSPKDNTQLYWEPSVANRIENKSREVETHEAVPKLYWAASKANAQGLIYI